MAQSYKQAFSGLPQAHFDRSMNGEIEKSRIDTNYEIYLTMNAGDLVPVECMELLPNQSVQIDLGQIIRQTTVMTPTMGSLEAQVFAFFVPNRIVNESWKNVMGENTSGSWTAPDVSLAPLYVDTSGGNESVKVPVGSVADYYDYPTQGSLPSSLLQQCHDLKFRGYLEIYNEYFRDQNYQPPIPYSKLNIYNGFFERVGTTIGVSARGNDTLTINNSDADGSFPGGSLVHAIAGDGGKMIPQGPGGVTTVGSRVVAWSALDSPLKVNKCHDYFTSVTPTPQKGESVFVPVANSSLPIRVYPLSSSLSPASMQDMPGYGRQKWYITGTPTGGSAGVQTAEVGLENGDYPSGLDASNSSGGVFNLTPANLGFFASQLEGDISINDLRTAIGIQQVYEILARSGSRYREYTRAMFGISIADPYSDIPQRLDDGHFRFDLDLFQTAQTSSSAEGSTPQGHLAAFGYTKNYGRLLHYTALEHGYLHILVTIRQRNIYASYFPRTNTRMNMLDWYQPPLANISEQPVYKYEINPFTATPKDGFGYQEAWADYRFFPDRVKGLMRPGVTGSLAIWNYADDFDSTLSVANADWLKSNAQLVVDRTLAVKSELAPQFKAQFHIHLVNELPMPVYSVPGMDTI